MCRACVEFVSSLEGERERERERERESERAREREREREREEREREREVECACACVCARACSLVRRWVCVLLLSMKSAHTRAPAMAHTEWVPFRRTPVCTEVQLLKYENTYNGHKMEQNRVNKRHKTRHDESTS